MYTYMYKKRSGMLPCTPIAMYSGHPHPASCGGWKGGNIRHRHAVIHVYVRWYK
jgi:hypothetical protein